MDHHFNTDIATEHGIECAVILQNLYFWIKKNIANEKNNNDGNYWTYNSVKAFSKLFPYMTEKRIRSALLKLEENGLIITGNYNKSAYDRTKWYAMTEKAFSLFGESILLKGQMESTEKANQFDPEGEPIPYINTDDKPDNKPDIKNKPKKHDLSEETIAFTQWFYDTMNKPTRYKNKTPNLKQWAFEADKLHRIDKLEWNKIYRVAEWALKDNFWSGNILSTEKFREKFDDLEKQSSRKPKQQPSQTEQERLEAFREACE